MRYHLYTNDCDVCLVFKTEIARVKYIKRFELNQWISLDVPRLSDTVRLLNTFTTKPEERMLSHNDALKYISSFI